MILYWEAGDADKLKGPGPMESHSGRERNDQRLQKTAATGKHLGFGPCFAASAFYSPLLTPFLSVQKGWHSMSSQPTLQTGCALDGQHTEMTASAGALGYLSSHP